MFHVAKCFGRSEVRQKDFSHLKDAENYIQEQLLKDIELKVAATYRIYEGADQVAERTQKDAISLAVETPSSDLDSVSSSSQQGSDQIFNPTPLPTSPRPPGMPQNWKAVNKDDKKEDKKE